MTTRPRLLFHCQHALGLGHLARSLALADGLQERFDVVVLNGGRFPAGTVVPAGVDVVNLPPLGHDADYQLVSHDPLLDVDAACAARVETILTTLDRVDPAAVLVELYPFGRKKFAFELEPLLEAVHARGARRPRVVCSVRDILVNQRRDQARHDQRAAERLDRWFDLVLVHADPAFATLEESFRPGRSVDVPIAYTGFVTRDDGMPATTGPRLERVIVSAGGGMVGGPLFDVAATAAAEVRRRTGLTTTIVAGPFLPEETLTDLVARAAADDACEVVPHVVDLAAHIAASTVSVSQCGYNTTMDLLRAGTPALVVPYAEGREDEQQRRAERLDRLGVLRSIDAGDLTPGAYVDAVAALAGTRPRPLALDLGGRACAARLVAELCDLPDLEAA